MNILAMIRNATVMLSAVLQSFVDKYGATENSELIYLHSVTGYKHESASVSIWKDASKCL